MDGGKFNWSNGDPATIARNIRQIKSNDREFIASVHNSIGPALSYVTQGNGFAYSGIAWNLSGSAASNDKSIVLPFDPAYDLDIQLDVPFSKQFTVSLSAWAYAQVYIYTGNSGQQPANLQLRTGVLAYGYLGDNDNVNVDGHFGGAQVLTSAYGSNSKATLAIAASATSRYVVNDDAKTMHVRTRRWYWPTYSDNNGAAIEAPDGSWYVGFVSDVSVQITPIYVANPRNDSE